MSLAAVWIPTNSQNHWIPRIFSRIREDDPKQLDRRFIESIVGHNHQSSVRKIIEFLEIANINGNRGPNYEKLSDYSNPRFKENLKEVIFDKYSAILEGLDLSTVTGDYVVSRIMHHYKLDRDEAMRAKNVLVHLCRFASIETSQSFRYDQWRKERLDRKKKVSELKQLKDSESSGTQLSRRKIKRMARWIKLAREQAGFSHYRLGHRIGVWPQQVKAWEEGSAIPPKEMLQRISNVLQIKLDPKLTEGALKQWLQKRMEELGLTRDQLARQAGISVQTVYLIERGKIENPTKITIDSLEKVLGKMPSELSREVQEKGKAGEFPYAGPFPVDKWRDVIHSERRIPCVYIFYDETDIPRYVGQTGDLKERMNTHERTAFWFNRSTARRFAYVTIKHENTRKEIETVLIKVLGRHLLFNNQEKLR